LSNTLSRTNVITDGFYDLGSVGGNVASIKSFPSLDELTTAPVDKKREILLINSTSDPTLADLVKTVSDAMAARSPTDQIKFIAQSVTDALGGCVASSKTANIGFKVHITTLKLSQSSNVIPIGILTHGTFYHRALLFKTLCDKIGLSPVSLVRGEYGRAWNEVEMGKVSVGVGKRPKSGKKSEKSEEEVFEARQYGEEEEGGRVGIVDLMYEAGRVIELGSKEARDYMKAS
jgi:hypothetical protein